jgi:ABC-type lipoprotein release transport system permease subunit
MRSFQLGVYNHMINNIVTQFSGHLQIQEKDYFDNPSINNSLAFNDSIKNKLNSIKEINFYTPRIQTGVLASSGNNSKVAMIMGVDMKKENSISNINKKIVRYIIDTNIIKKISLKLNKKLSKKLNSYKAKAYTNKNDLAKDLYSDGIDTAKFLKIILQKSQLPNINISKKINGILVGIKLAQYLELKIGDSIILIGQGFHGASAIGKYRIAGFLKFPTDAFNSRIIYMSLRQAQNFLSAYEINNDNDTNFFVSNIVVNTIYQASIQDKDYKKIMKVKNKILKALNNKDIAVIGWRNLNKDLIQGIELDNGSGKIIIGVLYLIIAFGILGTVMMMIAERKREFGVMLALGMKRTKLSLILTIEMLYMGIIAVISAIIITAPIIYTLHNNPIHIHGQMAQAWQQYNMEPVLPLAWFGSYIFAQVIVVLAIVSVILIYALLKIKKLKVVEALKN